MGKIKEFGEYRKRMNEKLLAGNNKVTKNFLFSFFYIFAKYKYIDY